MKTQVPSSIVRRILCVLIAFGLMLAPVQLVQPASATPAMDMSAMGGSDCEQKPPKCCDQGKKDCSQMPGCFAKCGGFSTPATQPAFVMSLLTKLDANGIALVLEPHATSPPRRPPRI